MKSRSIVRHDDTVNVYLINLDSRQDRLDQARKQLEHFGIDFERVSAVASRPDFSIVHPFVTPSVAAIWLSHVKALSMFLESGSQRALILEDDFLICSRKDELIKRIQLVSDYDLLQVGFLVTNFFDWISYKFVNISDLFFKTLSRYSHLSLPFSKSLSKKFLVYKQDSISLKIVKGNFRAGAHAYIVTRDFAEELLKFNNPIVFSTDQFYMSLAAMNSFNIARLRKSIIGQSKSHSSVDKRFISQKISTE